ncbi:MAG: alanine racemase [Chloroherpetonaceae bacterium]|nr:alanine racemase [Chloroherpetonaceae bacterium]
MAVEDIDILAEGLTERYSLPDEQLTEAFISKRNLIHNVDHIRQHLESRCKIIAVVKANAYGHSIDAVIPSLIESNIDYFGVANVNEGILLRYFLQKKNSIKFTTTPKILAFSAPLPDQIPFYLKHDIEATITGFESLRFAESITASNLKVLNVHLKIDTGMSRLGCNPKEAMKIAELIHSSKYLNLRGVYTHFASSGEDLAFTRKQLALFLEVCSSIEQSIQVPFMKHCANSGAIISDRETHLDAVRPGILLYGIIPFYTPSNSFNFRPVMQLQSKVTFTKWIEKGTTVSYGRKWKAWRRTRIATISIGYADGIPRLLSNNLKVLINGKIFNQVGIITMDQMMVNLENDASINEGDIATIFGWSHPEIHVDKISKKAGSISYELISSVSPRVRRVIVD